MKSVKLSTHNIYIETYILTYNKLRFGERKIKFLQYLMQRHAFFFCQCCRNAMDLLGIIRNIKAIGANEIILMLHQNPHSIVYLPGNLYTARPVVCIGNRGIPTFGQTGGFSIKNQVHGVRCSLIVLRNSNFGKHHKIIKTKRFGGY